MKWGKTILKSFGLSYDFINRRLILITILGYTVLHGFFSVCDSCLMDKRFWTPYYIVDGTIGGGCILWIFVYRYCSITGSKYKIAALATEVYSVVMLLWNVIIPALGFNRSDTKWSFLLTIWLIPVIYYTLFAPDGVLTIFLEKQLKRLPIVKKDSVDSQNIK